MKFRILRCFDKKLFEEKEEKLSTQHQDLHYAEQNQKGGIYTGKSCKY